MRLRYTPKALAELDRILAYIAERSPQGARNVQRRVQTVATLLERHPSVGRPGKRQLRRIIVSPYPYLIFYQLFDDDVVIVGVRHSARDPASMPE